MNILKKKTGFLLFLIFGAFYGFYGSQAVAMDQYELSLAIIREKLTRKKKEARFKVLSYPKYVITNMDKTINVFGGKNEDNQFPYTGYKEYIDIETNCSFTQESFKKQIKNAFRNNRRFILAAITTKGSGGFYRRYYSACGLCNWTLKENTFERKTENKYTLDILSKENIQKPIHFFSIDSLNGNFQYIGDETIFTQKTTKDSESAYNLKLDILVNSEDGGAILSILDCFCIDENKFETTQKAFEHAQKALELGIR